MRISAEKLSAEADATGFRPDVLEKAAQLLGLLNALPTHPALQGKLALKGGTALNLFILDVPRLSVDIDLNCVGAEDLESKALRVSLKAEINEDAWATLHSDTSRLWWSRNKFLEATDMVGCRDGRVVARHVPIAAVEGSTEGAVAAAKEAAEVIPTSPTLASTHNSTGIYMAAGRVLS